MTDAAFTGERLHADDTLFSVDLARHQAAYEFARSEARPKLARSAQHEIMLELGSGSGYGAASLVNDDIHVVAIDRVAPDIAHRRSRCAFLRADLNHLPLLAQSFDHVLSFQVIEHLEDPARHIDAIAQLLHPSGTALITTPNRLMSGGINPYHVREYSADELAPILTRRFEDVELIGISASPRVREYLEERSRRVQRVIALDPLRLRERLPRRLNKWLFARFATRVRDQIQRSSGTCEANWRDFPTGPAAGDCLDLMAICRGPR